MIVFLHIPKTAGSTFHFILENNLGLSFCHAGHTQTRIYDQRDLDFARRVFPSLQGLGGHNLVAPGQLSGRNFFHMTFLRDPISRVLSSYQEKTQHRQQRGERVIPFEEALETDEEFENLQVKLTSGAQHLEVAKRYLDQCGFVGFTECFDLSLHVLSKVSPQALDLRYRKIREQPDNRIRRELEADPAAMGLLREKNRLDLELYDYALREVFPRLCRQAGLEPDQEVASLNTYPSESSWRRRLARFYNNTVYRNLCKLHRRNERFNWNH